MSDPRPIEVVLNSLVGIYHVVGAPALLERFVLRNGTRFDGVPRPRGFRRKKAKECFANATRLALDGAGTYYEGYAMSRRLEFPFLHAWVVLDGGALVDPTLAKPEEYEYFGVPFAKEELTRELVRNECYGLLDTSGWINVPLIAARDPALVEQVRGYTSWRNR